MYVAIGKLFVSFTGMLSRFFGISHLTKILFRFFLCNFAAVFQPKQNVGLNQSTGPGCGSL